MAKRHKPSPITVTRRDGSTEIVAPDHFKRQRFNYGRYRRSPHWRAMRRRRLEHDEHRCQACKGRSGCDRLEVHHLTYERLYHELLEDLVTLCQRCHATEHQWMMRLAR